MFLLGTVSVHHQSALVLPQVYSGLESTMSETGQNVLLSQTIYHNTDCSSVALKLDLYLLSVDVPCVPLDNEIPYTAEKQKHHMSPR